MRNLRYLTALLGAAAVATAFAAPLAAQSPKERTEDKGERRVCKSLTVSGTRMPQLVCATKDEWDERNKESTRRFEDDRMNSDRQSFNIPDHRGD